MIAADEPSPTTRPEAPLPGWMRSAEPDRGAGRGWQCGELARVSPRPGGQMYGLYGSDPNRQFSTPRPTGAPTKETQVVPIVGGTPRRPRLSAWWWWCSLRHRSVRNRHHFGSVVGHHVANALPVEGPTGGDHVAQVAEVLHVRVGGEGIQQHSGLVAGLAKVWGAPGGIITNVPTPTT